MRISRERIDDFEWLSNPHTFYVFMRLLFKAKFKDTRWEGIDVKRGQLVTGRRALSSELNLSERQIRTCLDKLLKTGYIDQQTTNKYTIITICNYDSWVSLTETNDQQNVTQTTNKRPANDQQTTTLEIKKESKEEKEEDTNVSKKKSEKVFVPPTVEEVAEYIKQKGYHFDAKSFVDYYEADDWHYGQGTSRKKVSNWKRCCSTWENTRRNDSPDIFCEEEQKPPKILIIDGQVYR